MKLVYLEWEDATRRSVWSSEKDLDDLISERCLIQQVGWVYKENKDCIVLFSQVDKGTTLGDPEYGLIQKIPKTWIRKRKVLKI